MTGAEFGMERPPEGVLTGEAVPLENQQNDLERTAIDRLVSRLKLRQEYQGMDEDELREIAHEKLQKVK